MRGDTKTQINCKTLSDLSGVGNRVPNYGSNHCGKEIKKEEHCVVDE